MAWLEPRSAAAAVLSAVCSMVLPLAAQPVLGEQDLRFRTHSGGLCRFYLDALRGVIPVRAHAAEDAIRREHEELLVSWMRAGLARQRVAVALGSAGNLANLSLIAWMVIGHIARQGGSPAMLLFLYWALNVPALGAGIALLAWQYPKQKNMVLRLMEPLRAVEDGAVKASASISVTERTKPRDPAAEGETELSGVAIAFEDVTVRTTGHTILESTTVNIADGEHVCIVGPSGAGKSTFAGLLLGWHSPASGRIVVDGKALDNTVLEDLRLQQRGSIPPYRSGTARCWRTSTMASTPMRRVSIRDRQRNGQTCCRRSRLCRKGCRRVSERVAHSCQAVKGSACGSRGP